MALAGQKTKSDYIEWNKLNSLVLKLDRDGEWKFSLLISIGMFCGMRISDILSLKWSDLIDRDFIEITEKKTGKFRRIKINPNLHEIVSKSIDSHKLLNQDDFIFLNRFNTSTISVQYVNRKLKEIVGKYNVVKNPLLIKSHSLRKSFGRRVFENNENSERSLILLSEMFNHSNIKTTKVYLGIRDKEIFDVYDNL